MLAAPFHQRAAESQGKGGNLPQGSRMHFWAESGQVGLGKAPISKQVSRVKRLSKASMFHKPLGSQRDHSPGGICTCLKFRLRGLRVGSERAPFPFTKYPEVTFLRKQNQPPEKTTLLLNTTSLQEFLPEAISPLFSENRASF